MWNKIYTAILGISFILSAGLTYYAYTWLQSVGSPVNVVQNFEYYANAGRMFLWTSSIILLVLANVILWTTGNAWAMWTTLIYFALFILIQTFWLDKSFLSYQQNNGIAENAFFLTAFTGIILCVLAAIGIFFDQFIVKKMYDRTHQSQTETKSEPHTKIN